MTAALGQRFRLVLEPYQPLTLQPKVRNPGDPGSKPFLGYTTSSDSFRAPAEQPSKPDTSSTLVSPGDMQGAESSESFQVDSDGKIRPIVRTRFRSKSPAVINTNRVPRPGKKKTGKIVLKRRKVKKLRNRPRKRPVSETVKSNGITDALGQGSAPEANRGRPLAELAFATLSREEQSEETNSVFGTPRFDVQC